MSVKTISAVLVLGAFMILPATVYATEDNGGFGQPFANSGHAGFETPAAFEDDGSALQDIEPAAGEEIESENQTETEVLNDEIHADTVTGESIDNTVQ